MHLSYDDFLKVDMRVGKIIDVQDFPEARKPAYKLTVDFGQEIGIRKSSAQITQLYTKEQLTGKLVVCTINFPPKQIGPFISQCLTMGAADANGNVALLTFAEQDMPLGLRIF